MRKCALIAAAGIAVAAASPWAAAQESAPRAGIHYVSGGIGLDEEARLSARRHEFNLKLLFTLAEGNYLADVDVTVADAKGARLIADRANGPFFMAKLPPGQYTVTATHEGRTQMRRVNVGAGGLSTVHLRWPSNPATDYVAAGAR